MKKTLFYCLIALWVSGEGMASWLDDLRLKAEVKGHYRDSDDTSVGQGLSFPEALLPNGSSRGFLQTVDPDEHFEFSSLMVEATLDVSDSLRAFAKVDIYDLYDRNPTSEDNQIDLDELSFLYGTQWQHYQFPDESTYYVKFGKFGKFDRQNRRNLESYGLASTAFNRFEDSGFELGYDPHPNFYLRGSFTTGNPIFMRDPNSLAGDNGTGDLGEPLGDPDPELNSGFPIIYDAEIEDLDLGSNAELGLGLGFRMLAFDDALRLNILFWAFERELDDKRDLHGSSIEGDLELLNGSFGQSLPITDDEKEEWGANLWVYFNQLTLFAQYVDQELAGLTREAHEVEVSYAIDLPEKWTFKDEPLFTQIIPAFRYSEIDPQFAKKGFVPASLFWEWAKYDFGLRLKIYSGLDLTVEYLQNDFIVAGRTVENDEFLATLRWSIDLL